jgi:hypothetical protein
LLKAARCDVITGEKKDRAYKKKKRIEVRRANRRARAWAKQLGKLGPASEVRIIEPSTGGSPSLK